MESQGTVRMRKCGAVAVALSVAALWAAPARRAALPVSPWADTEISTNVAMAAWEPHQKSFAYELAFDATPSNSVQAAFGVDRNADGVLSPGEEALVVGWDCGEWFMLNASNGARVVSGPVSADAAQTLRCTLATKSDGMRRAFTATVGANAVFEAVSADLPEWIYDTRWNLVRFTARGVGDPSARFQAQTVPAGFHFVFR